MSGADASVERPDAAGASGRAASPEDGAYPFWSRYKKNASVVLRYPFAAMNLSWWDEYIRTVPAATRVTTMLRVMDCLMAHTLLHDDRVLEEAVMHMHKKLPKNWPSRVTNELANYFEIAHHAFRTNCVMSKFASLDAAGKASLLTMIESRVREIEKAMRPPPPSSATATNNKGNSPAHSASGAVAKAAQAALERVQALQKDPGDGDRLARFTEALRTLFFAVSTKSGVAPRTGAEGPPYNTYPCGPDCACYRQLLGGPTIFLREVERVKVIDCVMYAAVKNEDDFLRGVVGELLTSHFRDTVENPMLDDVSRFIHNGVFFFCRTAIFDTLPIIQYIMQLHSDPAQTVKDGKGDFDRVVLFIVWLRDVLQDKRDLCELVPLLERTLVTAEGVYDRLGKGDCLQALHLIRDCLTITFAALSAPGYHLAVHSRDTFVGKALNVRCAYSGCPGKVNRILMCSGCDMTRYCCAECQLADWKRHKKFCYAFEAMRGKPTVIASEPGPVQRIMPRI